MSATKNQIKTNLRTMIHSLIAGDESAASKALHDVIVSKSAEIISVQDEPGVKPDDLEYVDLT